MTEETDQSPASSTTPGALNRAAREFMDEVNGRSNSPRKKRVAPTEERLPEPPQDVGVHAEKTAPADTGTRARRAGHIMSRLKLIHGGDVEEAVPQEEKPGILPAENQRIDLSQPLSAGNLAFPSVPEGPLDFKPPEDLYDPAKQERPTA